MASNAIRIDVNQSPANSSIAELNRLLEGVSEFELDGKVFPQAVELVVDGTLCADKAFRIRSNAATGRAGDVLLSLEPTECLLEFLAALRAFHGDLRRVEADAHESFLSVG